MSITKVVADASNTDGSPTGLFHITVTGTNPYYDASSTDPDLSREIITTTVDKSITFAMSNDKEIIEQAKLITALSATGATPAQATSANLDISALTALGVSVTTSANA